MKLKLERSPVHSKHIIEYISPAKLLIFVIICNLSPREDVEVSYREVRIL